MGEIQQMKAKVFLDTNILLDLFVSNRKSETAAFIMTAVKQNMIEAFVTTQSLLDAHYISHKSGVHYDDYVRLIKELRKYVNVGEIDMLDFDSAIEHYSGDLEDDAQYDRSDRKSELNLEIAAHAKRFDYPFKRIYERFP